MTPTFTDAWIAIAAVAGVPIGWEETRHPERRIETSARALLLLSLAATAGADSETWRGFAYVLLMPIGAYKVGAIAGELLALAVPARRWRDGDAA